MEGLAGVIAKEVSAAALIVNEADPLIEPMVAPIVDTPIANEHALEDAINSESTWSPEYFSQWHARPQQGTLGNISLIVLTSADAGYGDSLDIPSAQLEVERKRVQAQMALLSSNGKQKIVQAGHNLQVEDPTVVVQAIRDVVMAARK